jgi:hypothetical protein
VEVLDRMTDEAPWFALAEGETFLDMVVAALAARGKILCPQCRSAVHYGGAETGPQGIDQPPPSTPSSAGRPGASPD